MMITLVGLVIATLYWGFFGTSSKVHVTYGPGFTLDEALTVVVSNRAELECIWYFPIEYQADQHGGVVLTPHKLRAPTCQDASEDMEQIQRQVIAHRRKEEEEWRTKVESKPALEEELDAYLTYISGNAPPPTREDSLTEACYRLGNFPFCGHNMRLATLERKIQTASFLEQQLVFSARVSDEEYLASIPVQTMGMYVRPFQWLNLPASVTHVSRDFILPPRHPPTP